MTVHSVNELRRDKADSFDEEMMGCALRLARRGEGRVEPNPMVGCVIVRNGRIIGEGFHHRFGGPHAEIEALKSCRGKATGATAYVSLEPCCYFGKTPPCTEALIAARIDRVVAAVRDPNPRVHGGGVKLLRAAGIRVDLGIRSAEGARLIAPFTTHIKLGRPYIIAKWAQSLDGKLATASGHSQWISCAESRRIVHRLRARVDAVMVGSGTVLRDDPRLTARGVSVWRRALRVVLDTRLRFPERSRLASSARKYATLIFTGREHANGPKAVRLRKLGVEIVGTPTIKKRVDLAFVLDNLANRGMVNVMIEGGPTVLTSFLHGGWVDEAYVFVAPVLFGGLSAPSVLMEHGPRPVQDALRPITTTTRRIGKDQLYHLILTEPP